MPSYGMICPLKPSIVWFAFPRRYLRSSLGLCLSAFLDFVVQSAVSGTDQDCDGFIFGTGFVLGDKETAKQMSKHGYDSDRLNLPFVGICTFGKYPYVEDWDAIEADVAVMGAPFDFGTQWRSGARMGPRAIREASTLFSFGHAGAYDHEDDVTYLDPAKVTIVDIGDADIVHTNTEMSHANIAHGVRKILAAGAIPVVLGGDHSINIPCINAFEDQDPIHIVQIDAHLDFVDERHGVRFGHGNPMRRAAEKAEKAALEALQARLEAATAERTELEEEHSGDEGFFAALEKINKANVKARRAPWLRAKPPLKTKSFLNF